MTTDCQLEPIYAYEAINTQTVWRYAAPWSIFRVYFCYDAHNRPRYLRRAFLDGYAAEVYGRRVYYRFQRMTVALGGRRLM